MPDILSTSISGLRAYQSALATTSHNIANVGTEGYSRQRVELTATPPQSIGSNQIGQGVNISEINRIYDSFAVENIRDFTSSSSRLSMFEYYASRTENLIADEYASLMPAMDSYFSALSDVSNDPSSTAPRISLLESSENLEQRFVSLAKELQSLEQEIDQQLEFATQDVNALAQEIANINEALAKVNSADDQPADLLDQRDQLIKQLAEKVTVNTVEQSDGTFNVLIGTGQLLVSGSVAQSLSVKADVTQPDRKAIHLQSSSGSVDITSTLTGGEIGGLLDYRSNMLDSAQNELGRLAIAVSETINQQHVAGYDLNGDLGQNYFSTVGTGNLGGSFGGDYLTNGFDVGETSSFDLQFDGVTLNVAVPAVLVTDTNRDIGQNVLDAIGTAAAVAANADGSYTVNGTTAGTSVTFQLSGDQIVFTSTGGPSPLGNNLVISNVADSGASDATLLLNNKGASSTTYSAGTASTGSSATFIGPSNIGSVIPNLTNTGGGIVDFSITDATALTASDYQIDYDGVNYNVVRLSDNATVDSGAGPYLNADGIEFTVAGAPAIGDSFYIRPTKLGAVNFELQINSTADIAIAAPNRTLVSSSNLGNVQATQASVIDAADANLLNPVTITFNSPATTFDVLDVTTGVTTAGVAYSDGVTVQMNGWEIQLTGSPEAGDVIRVEENAGAATDNRNGLLLGALQGTPLLDGNTSTYQQAYNTLTTNVGSMTQQAKINLQVEENLLGAAIQDRETISGVNLDEEAADLIRFQQAYEALSRVIQTSQEIFQSLLDSI
ncbi:MAG: flagellar hook-associated protein FlgK [Gammaproteobacteria bacterium]|nr:flagellar hook-associated protein FlgK [Gammaproteobacteria bacterium]